MLFNHLILCCPLLLLLSIFPGIRVFSNESALCIKWPKYWSFRFSISPSSDYSGLISFRIDWFNLLSVQGTQEYSPAPQFESINSSEFSPLYGPTHTSIHDYWENHRFDYMDLCPQVMYPCSSMLSRFVIPFLSRRKCLLILWLDFCQITASSLCPEACEILGVPFKSYICISSMSQMVQW